jgi:hypothetical protein
VILSDFCCPDCGPFEALVSAEDETAPCPDCNKPSPWVPSPVHGRVKLASFSYGKSDPVPFAHALDTRPLADGMDPKEFKAARRKIWQERRRQENRAKLS